MEAVVVHAHSVLVDVCVSVIVMGLTSTVLEKICGCPEEVVEHSHSEIVDV